MLFCKNVIYWGSPEVRKLECWNIGMLEGWKVGRFKPRDVQAIY